MANGSVSLELPSVVYDEGRHAGIKVWLRSRGNDPKHVERVGGLVVKTDSVRKTEKVLLGTWGGGRKTRFWTSKGVQPSVAKGLFRRWEH